MLLAIPSPAYASKGGLGLPALGLESYKKHDGYQFTSGAYYRLTDEGKYAEESTADDWNIRWTGDTSSGTLELKDAHIKGTLFVPGGTTVKVSGDCSVNVWSVAIQQQTDGDLVIDLAAGSTFTLDCSSQGECLYSGPNAGSGDVSITGEGVLVYGARSSGGDLVAKKGTLHIGGNVTVRDLDGAQPNALIAQDILVDGNADVDMQGKIGQIACTDSLTVGGSARLKVSGTANEVVTYATDLKVSGSAEFTIENTTPDGFATASYNNGPITVEGSGKLIASAVSDDYAVISTGSSSSTKASDITVTGSGSIITRGGFNGVEVSGANSALRVSGGGKVSVTGAYNGIDLSGSRGMFVDGGTIEVTDCSSAVEVDGSSAEQPATISIKNGSTLSFNVRNKGLWATNFIDEYELTDSTVRSVAGECFSSSVPSTFSYSTDANLKIGDSADSAKAVDVDEMDFQAKYVEIVPSAEHAWASEWSNDATHHWHVCTNSHCTLDPANPDDVAQMGGYAAHSGGEATYEHGAYCEACGVEYTDPEPSPVFTVTFDTNGGSQLEAQEVTLGDCAERPADPVRKGYAFEGWFADEQLTAVYDFSTPVTGDITLYAKWEKKAVAPGEGEKPNGGGKDPADSKGPDSKKPGSKAPGASKGGLPQTGDTSGAAIAAVAVTGIAAMGAGIVLTARSHRRNG